MKAFVFNNSYNAFENPEDINKIADYLNQYGKSNIHDLFQLEKLYKQFSSDYSGGMNFSWITVNDESLLQFARWLARYEIEE